MNLFFWLQQHHWIIHQISLGHFDLLMTATAAYWQVSIQGKHCQPVCLLDCVSLTCRDRLENWYRSRFDGILFYSTLCLGTSFVIIDCFVCFDHFAFHILVSFTQSGVQMNNMNLYCACTHKFACSDMCVCVSILDPSLLLAPQRPQKVEQHNSFDVVMSSGWCKSCSLPAVWTETHTGPSDSTD